MGVNPTNFFDTYEDAAMRRGAESLDRFILKVVKRYLLPHAVVSISPGDADRMWSDPEIDDRFEAFKGLAGSQKITNLVVTRANVRCISDGFRKRDVKKSTVYRLYREHAHAAESVVMFTSEGQHWVIHRRPDRAQPGDGPRITWRLDADTVFTIQLLESYLEEY
jgi:hypothetical protein